MTGGATRQVTELETYVAALPEAERAIFHRVFHVQTVMGQLIAPVSMRNWIESAFGDVQPVLRQRIVDAVLHDDRKPRPFSNESLMLF